MEILLPETLTVLPPTETELKDAEVIEVHFFKNFRIEGIKFLLLEIYERFSDVQLKSLS